MISVNFGSFAELDQQWELGVAERRLQIEIAERHRVGTPARGNK
jgi:hypothetical protein